MALHMSPLILNSFFIPLNSSFGKHENRRGPNLFMHRVSFPFQCLATSNVTQRNTANYKPSFWSYDFLQSLKHHYADERYEERAKKLREKVRGMMKHENGEIWETLELIDHVKRLGLSYHFEKEIEEALDRLLYLDRFGDAFIHTSLHEVALSFRLLREHGYCVTPDVLERFKEQNGNNFKACLSRDVKGMLSLYEASFHAYEGEEILDEAKAFTRFHLKDLLNNNNDDRRRSSSSNSIILEQVSHALELPLHRRIQRLESRRYIEAYGKRKDANLILLEAAKLDFNIVQSTHQRELQEMSSWWKGMGLAAKLSFSRDRLMECYFWTVGMASEPHFSDFRKGLTKVNCLITTLDDVYDIYGTLDELELFTAAVASWDIKAVQVLPEYMKMCFLALYNTVNELAYDTLKNQGQDILPYLIKAWSDLLKAFLQEARWGRDKHLPTFEQYLNNGLVSVSGVLMLINAYFMLNHNINEEALDALHNCHALLCRPSIVLRLFNDLATSTAELQRGEETSSILCYMHENGASEECAHKHIHSLVDETWKKMNKDRVTHCVFPKPFLETTINLARISQFTYQNGDGLGAPDSTTNDRIRSLIVEPIINCTHEGYGDKQLELQKYRWSESS